MDSKSGDKKTADNEVHLNFYLYFEFDVPAMLVVAAVRVLIGLEHDQQSLLDSNEFQCHIFAESLECRSLAALDDSPCMVCALAMRSSPSWVLGPVERPPWCVHFWVLLEFIAGLEHCFPDLTDLAVHRKQRIAPPASVTYSSYSEFVISLLT